MTEFNAAHRDQTCEPARRPGDPRVVAGRHHRRHALEQHGPPSGLDPPAAEPDGFHGDTAAATVLTHHLTFFGLKVDDGPPTPPRHIAGVVASDGLTLRWIPGTDASGQLGNVLLYVNGEHYRTFGPRQYETKMGPFTPGDSRIFTLVQLDAAGNRSAHGEELRAVPPLVGMSRDQAVAALAAAGFELGDGARAAGQHGRAGYRRRPDRTAPRGPVDQDRLRRLARGHRAADAARLLRRRLQDGHAAQADDDRCSGQGLPARHSDRDALHGGEEAALHLAHTTPQRPVPTS